MLLPEPETPITTSAQGDSLLLSCAAIVYPSFRQLLHVSFKLAAKKGQRYLDLLEANAEIVGKNVTENLYERHLKPLFAG